MKPTGDRGIAAGVTWFEHGDKVERTIAAPDDRIRDALDRLVAVVPEDLQRNVAQFLAPLLEKNEPARAGEYHGGFPGGRSWIVWWKRTHVLFPMEAA